MAERQARRSWSEMIASRARGEGRGAATCAATKQKEPASATPVGPSAPPQRFGKARHMFIAMNRFKVIKGSEAAFENVWLSRDTHLDTVPGFIEFHLLKGPEAEDHTLYASHTVWKNRAAFEAWTKSEAFRAAHASAGGNKPLYLGHPQFEGFETIQTVGGGKGTGRVKPH